MTTSLRIEIPHYLTRYTDDTINLQHVFNETGLRSPSYMGGITKSSEVFRMHLHYKSLNVFRKTSAPIATMISAFLLDLAVMEMVEDGKKWGEDPGALLAFLSINTGAFLSLASIKVGSTLRSLLNGVRFLGVAWIIFLTAAIRASSFPIIDSFVVPIIDSGIKGSIVWLAVSSGFSFIPYGAFKEPKKRDKYLYCFLIIGIITWVLLIMFTKRLDIANTFAEFIFQ